MIGSPDQLSKHESAAFRPMLVNLIRRYSITGQNGIIHRAVLKRVRNEKYLARLIAIRIGTTFGGTNQVSLRAASVGMF